MTKEQLQEYRNIKKELDALEVMHRKIDKLGNFELIDYYKKSSEKLSNELLRIEMAFDTLSYTERTLMRLRYIEGLSWQAICGRIGYSWQQTHRIHARALIKIKDL